MRIIVTGSSGMLGRQILKSLSEQEIIPAGRSVCDITDGASVESFFSYHKPDVVIHCAAMTAVDECESRSEEAFKINAYGSLNVASACSKIGAKIIAISTDYVFDGSLDRPYNEYDAPAPKTIYGKSKYAGEEAVRQYCPDNIILRISWLYGSGGPSFVHSMVKLADGTRPLLKIVDDQIGNPTSVETVANGIKNILNKSYLNGVFHFSSEGECSWFDFAEEIFRIKGINQKIERCSTEEFPRPAPRPCNSRMDKMNLRFAGLPPMPFWKDALKEFLDKEKF